MLRISPLKKKFINNYGSSKFLSHFHHGINDFRSLIQSFK